MALSDFVTSSITSATRTPSQAGYGTPLFACYFSTSIGTGLVRVYNAATALSAMVTDGFSTNGAPYAMVAAALSQNPAPSTIKLGRRQTVFTQTFTLKCLTAVQNAVYSVSLTNTATGTVTPITYTVGASATTTTVAAAIATLIAAVSGFASATSATDTITATLTTPGNLFRLQNWSNNFYFADTTPDPSSSLTADLTAIAAVDNDWYGLDIDTHSALNLTAAAAFAEANTKLAAFHSCDTAVADNASTTDILYVQKGLAHMRSYWQYNGKDSFCYAGSAILGSRLPQPPGSDTWDLKTLAGVAVDDSTSLTATQEAAVIAKNGNVYTTVANINVTRQGVVASGEYADVVRFRDWVNSTMTARVFQAMINAQKIPYSDLGTEVIAAQVRSTLEDGVKIGGFKNNPAPVVTVALVSAQSSTDRASRKYGGITWQAYLAGAIHLVTLTGTVSV